MRKQMTLKRIPVVTADAGCVRAPDRATVQGLALTSLTMTAIILPQPEKFTLNPVQ